MTTTYVLVKVTHKYPVEGLAQKAANRAYTLQGVDDAEAINVSQDKLEALVNAAKSVPTAGQQADAYADAYDSWMGCAG